MAKQRGSDWLDADRILALSPAAAYLGSTGKGSHRTVQQSMSVLAGLVAGDGTDPMKFRWEALTRADTVLMRSTLKERYAPATANKMLSVLRGVLRTARDLGLMKEGQYQTSASLELIKAAKPEAAAPVDDNAVTKLLNACLDEPGASGHRDAAMLVIFLCSGLRRAEAAALDVGDYDPKTGQLHIRGERPEYDRVVTLAKAPRRVLAAWLEVRTAEPGPLLTPVDRGGLIRFRRMTDQAVYDIFGRIALRAGLANVTLRDLRRAYVVSLIRSGKPVSEVQYLTGHASWVTTAAYRGLAEDETAPRYDLNLKECRIGVKPRR
jgi:integrase